MTEANELTAQDEEIMKILSPEDASCYRDARINGATETWWLDFKKKMFLKGMDLIHDLLPRLGLGEEHTKCLREAEDQVLARFDEQLKQVLPCRRCQECGHLTSLPFTHKVLETCLDGGEHKFKDFPNGESEADLAHAAELIKRPRRDAQQS